MSEHLEAPVDLHTHTTYSDGEFTPQQLIDYASGRGIAALAIADHDTVASFAEPGLYEYANSVGVELVAGVEISTADSEQRRFHVLGLCMDPTDPGLLRQLDELGTSRKNYTANVITLLETHGWQVDRTLLDLEQALPKSLIAQAVVNNAVNHAELLKAFGDIPSRGEFIETYMNPGQECYVARQLPTPEEAIHIIHSAGGLAFMAHPVACVYEQGLTKEDIEESLAVSGYDGIEAIYYYYYKSGGDREIDEIDTFKRMANRQNMLITGGSDFHGDSTAVGNYMDIGYRNKTVYPTLGMLRSIQQVAQMRRKNL